MKEKKTSYMLAVITLVSLSFILGTSEFIMIGILPEISESLQISISKAGGLVTLFALVYAIGTPIITTFAGKYNRYYFILLISVVFVIGNLLNAVSYSYGVLLGSRIITALASGTLISLSLAYANEFVPQENKAKVLSWIFSGFSIASVIGVPIGKFITNMLGWRAYFLAITIVAIIITIAMWRLLPPAKPTEVTSLMSQLSLLKDRRILFGVGLPLFSLAGTYSFYTYLTPILEDKLLIPTGYVSIILLFFGVAAIISNLASGAIAGKHGINKMPVIYIIHTALLTILPFSVNNAMICIPLIFVLCVMMYLTNAPIQMHFMNVATDDYPQSLTLASSLNSVFANFGISLGSFAGGQVVEYAGTQYTAFAGTILLIIAVVFAYLLIYSVREKKSVKIKDIKGTVAAN
ncbi:MFS transporter [Clostridium neonatale]|uniref:MFS transporter n=1 Tax=Clostridium neonatale TaxID=137838 RepID=UPI00374FD0CE